jgi:hypothetical protein
MTVWNLSPRNQEIKVSLFLLVIIVGRLIILNQIVICWNPTGLGISRLLLKGEILQNLFLINMSHPIWDIYLKKERTLFCVRMLTLKLHSLSRSISTKQTQPTCHHYGVTGHIKPHCHQIWHKKPRIKKQEQKIGKCSFKSSKSHHASRQKQQYRQRGSPSYRHNGKNGHTKAKYFRKKPHKPKEIQIYEGLVYMIKNVLVNLDILDIAYNLTSQVKNVWIKKYETIHSLRGSRLT